MPVTVWDPPAWLETVEPGEAVVVVGRLRRRFYQRPGGVGSRVDVEAEMIGRARDRRRIDAALARPARSRRSDERHPAADDTARRPARVKVAESRAPHPGIGYHAR